MIAVQIIGGLILLLVGGELLVRGAVAIAKKLGISTLVIGLTVVAFGTSSPELVVSVQAAMENHPDIALGNVIGSNISNILLILGLTAAIYPIPVEKRLAYFDGRAMLYLTILMYLLCWSEHRLIFLEGVILFIALIAYVVITIYHARKSKSALPAHQLEEIEEQVHVNLKPWQAVIFTVAGIGTLVYGADILVIGSVALAKIFHVPEAVIGVTLVALGSSAPELATCVIAAYRKHSDIAIGNIIGSNIFNIASILGIASMVTDIKVSQRFIDADLMIATVVTLILFAVMRKIGTIHRVTGILFIVGYIGYITYQVISS